MKICLYLEFYHFWGGFLYKNIGTGLLSSYENQKNVLRKMGVEFTESWDDSCDILQINTPWLKSLWLIKKAKAKNKKVIIWAHVTAEDFKGVFRFNNFLAPFIKRYLTYAYGLADIIFTPSEYTKSLLVAYKIPAEKIIPKSNGVNTDRFVLSNEKREIVRNKYKLSGLVVGTVGLAVPRKGINSFLFLAENFLENKFIWFGKIYNSLLVKSLPKKLPSNVQFSGYVDDIVGAFSALDVFVFPSYEENQGMVILEAASMGLPILVRNIPVYEGWLIDGENCLKADNDEEFRVNLNELLKDNNLRRRLGEQAMSLAHKHSIAKIAKETLGVYKSLLTAI